MLVQAVEKLRVRADRCMMMQMKFDRARKQACSWYVTERLRETKRDIRFERDIRKVYCDALIVGKLSRRWLA